MSTVITPFQGTEPFSTVTFNNRISQINTGFSYISNPNLLDNWYFGNPVNQRQGYVVPKGVRYWQVTSGYPEIGITESYYTVAKIDNVGNPHFYIDGVEYYVDHNLVSPAYVRGYTGAGYGIDRWYLVGDTASVIINNDSITLNGGTSGAWWNQYLDNQDKFIGRTVTFSVLYTRNNLQTVTGALTSDGMLYLKNAPNGWDTVGVENGRLRLQISCNANLSKSPIAAKLELGTEQTLAHQDADGNWVLNEIPDYGEQLRRCQRYFVNFNPYKKAWFAMPPAVTGAVSTTEAKAFSTVSLPVAMRAEPVVSYGGTIFLSQTGNVQVTDVQMSSSTFTGNNLQLIYITAGGLTENSLYRVQGGYDTTSYIWLSADL